MEKQGNDLVDQLTRMEKQNKKYANDQTAIEKLKEKNQDFAAQIETLTINLHDEMMAKNDLIKENNKNFK